MLLIDAGHGGSDPGAVGRVLKEKDVALQISFLLKEYLDSKGAMSQLIRTNDNRWPLQDRANFANASVAKHLISIHVNSFTNPAANGIETFVASSGGDREAFARKVQQALVKETGALDRGVKVHPWYIIRTPKQDSILVEVGFISNAKEHDLMQKKEYLLTLAKAIGDGYMLHIKHNVPEIPNWEKIIRANMYKGESWIQRINQLMKKEEDPLDRWWPAFIEKLRR